MANKAKGRVTSTSKGKPKAKRTTSSHSDKPPPLTTSSQHVQLENFSVDSTSGHCLAHTAGKPCDCDEYSEDTNGQTGVVKCRECGHGHSKHKGAKRSKNVRSIVKDLVVKKFGGLDKMSMFQGAENEANKGFRPTVTKKVSQWPTSRIV
jgi:hypothetical protein